jgi:hypothetical protein
MTVNIKDIEVAAVVQKITQDDVRTKAQAEAILAKVSPAGRDKAIDAFRFNGTLRNLFPEKCFFDEPIQ